MKILKTTAEWQECLSMSGDFNLEKLQSQLTSAADRYIIPHIGEELADALVSYYSDGSPDGSNADMLKLLHAVQFALANYAFAIYLPEGNVNLESYGIVQKNSDNVKSAAWWAVKDVYRSFIEKGDSAMEKVLGILLKAESGTYTEWDTSDVRDQLNAMLVRTVAQFEQSQNIGGNRRTFLNLRYLIREVEEMYLETGIGADFVQDMRELEDPNTEEKEALRLMRKVVVNFAVARACRTHNYLVMPDGLRSKSVMTVNAFTEKETEASYKMRSEMEHEKSRMGNSYLEKLRRYLNEKASDSLFTTYRDSEYYTAPDEAEEIKLTKNTDGFLSI